MQTSQVQMKFREFQTSLTMASAKLYPNLDFHSLPFSSSYTPTSSAEGPLLLTKANQLGSFHLAMVVVMMLLLPLLL
jgi:hypothetical protein